MRDIEKRRTTTKMGKEAQDAVLAGVYEVINAAAVSLGPVSQTALIEELWGEPTILDDGVRISTAIIPVDPFARAGAKVIQEAAKRLRDQVGDGTTGVMVLTGEILRQIQELAASGVNPMSLRREIENAAQKAVAKIESMAIPVNTLDQKIQIATVSAKDATIGGLVGETVHKIGKDGVLTVDVSKGLETRVELQEGMQVDKGFAHPFMITDPERQMAILEDTYVFVTDYPLNSFAEMGKFFEQSVFPNTKKLLFIAPEFGIDFLNILLNMKMNGQFLGLAMRAPGVSHHQIEMLQDICALTGSTLITKEAAMAINEQGFEVLGKAEKVVMSKLSTIITGGGGHKKEVLARIATIKGQMLDTTASEWDMEQMRGRLAKLTNGVAVIKVGGETEIEMKERKERVQDAASACQSAVKFGMVPGGETVLVQAMTVLDEQLLGERILYRALRAPFSRLVVNAGYDSGEAWSELCRQKANVGFDATDGKFKNMLEAGIVDPASVPVTIVKTAVSVAMQLSTMGCAVTANNEE